MANPYIQLPTDMQNALSTNAGIILKTFDPSSPAEAETLRTNILFATTGGVSLTCVPSFKDWGEDIDSCGKGRKELLSIESYECKMSGTALTVTADNAVTLFGNAKKTTASEGVEKITPEITVDPANFKTLWYVCPYGTKGGFIAVELTNAMATGGFSLQSTDKEKGQYAFEFTGYTSIDTPETVPFNFYIKADGGVPAKLADVEVQA